MLDTKESWAWRARCQARTLVAEGITNKDILLLPFNFGPYTAFWGIYDLDQVIATELKRRLNLRIEVQPVPKGTLVWSDYKGKRFYDKRKQICNAG